MTCLPNMHVHTQTKTPKQAQKYRKRQTDMIKQMNMYGLKNENNFIRCISSYAYQKTAIKNSEWIVL